VPGSLMPCGKYEVFEQKEQWIVRRLLDWPFTGEPTREVNCRFLLDVPECRPRGAERWLIRLGLGLGSGYDARAGGYERGCIMRRCG